MSKIWTEHEINFLTLNYANKGGKHCGNILNRSSQSVINKAGRLGLKYNHWKKTNEQYLEELLEKEIDLLPLEPYIDSKTKIKHECLNEHIISIKPNDVLNGVGCPICRVRTHEDYQSLTKYKVLDTYINAKTNIRHECIKGHVWSARPQSILSGSGCPSCATHGFNQNKPGILYYLKITKNNQTYYKLGITNRTVAERFERDKDKQISIIHQIYYNKGLDAKEHEQKLLFKFKHKRVFVPGFLKSGGNSELFEYDIQPFQ